MGHAGVATGRGVLSLRSFWNSRLHFSFVQFRLLGARVISHTRIKGKERLLFLCVLCLRPTGCGSCRCCHRTWRS
ncbi:hypothetical protein FZD51_08085 [Bacillus infantis]|uniref:Uncharacterized protein n=1 Tax=Bacillus infantis TaxID=324767 RepID=A0A5D4RH52_9BACI|nr:hypothetical protein FZD51_08085 [Bacillus infantis]